MEKRLADATHSLLRIVAGLLFICPGGMTAGGVHRVRRDGLRLLHWTFSEGLLADPEPGPAGCSPLLHFPRSRRRRPGALQPGLRDPAPPGGGPDLTDLRPESERHETAWAEDHSKRSIFANRQ